VVGHVIVWGGPVCIAQMGGWEEGKEGSPEIRIINLSSGPKREKMGGVVTEKRRSIRKKGAMGRIEWRRVGQAGNNSKKNSPILRSKEDQGQEVTWENPDGEGHRIPETSGKGKSDFKAKKKGMKRGGKKNAPLFWNGGGRFERG